MFFTGHPSCMDRVDVPEAQRYTRIAQGAKVLAGSLAMKRLRPVSSKFLSPSIHVDSLLTLKEAFE